MIVIASGCSHIFGSDLDDVKYPYASKQVWPALVADQLGARCINISKIATGNQGIFRRTIVTLHDLVHNQKINPKDIVLLVQFSHWERHELIDRDFQWCGADFPYVSSNFMHDDLIPNSKKILDKIKSWFTSVDDSYVYLTNLQFAVMLHQWADKLGVKMFSTFVARPEVEVPEWATVGDRNIGLGDWDVVHGNVASKFFDIKNQYGLDCYHPQQTNLVFDCQTAVLNHMLNQYSTLNFGEQTNWFDFCRVNNFSIKKRIWEQGDQSFRPLTKIFQLSTGHGHWGEDAHAAAADIIFNQIKDQLS